jgi:type III pantothenate kinase
VIGRTTVHSMQAGIYFGAVGQVREIIRRMAEELGGAATVIATGGLAEAVSQDVPEISIVDPNLTLEGLRILYERNRMEKA